jgi:hypothetical protein
MEPLMKWRTVESWLLLLYFDCVMHFRGFERLHTVVKRKKVCSTGAHKEECAELCRAVDLACVFYFKRVLCLQRSSTTTILLRRHGYRAEMVVGAQLLPAQFHAWVEVDGCIVNDKPYVTDTFSVLERC